MGIKKRYCSVLIAVASLLVVACNKITDQPLPPNTGPDARSAYTGTYVVRDSIWTNGQLSSDPYYYYVLSVTTRNTRADTLFFNHLSNDTLDYYGILSGNTFILPLQSAFLGYTMSGSGSFTDSTVSYISSVGIRENHGHGTRF